MIFRKKQKYIKSNTEQAVASWINYLNQQRLDQFLRDIGTQNENLDKALSTMDDTFSTIMNKIVIRNRGGEKGMHGFIAEVAECGIGNARDEVVGKAPSYIWINDNGPADLLRDGIEIQQKFVNSGNHLSLQAIKQHLSTYPDFVVNGGKYQVPEDHYKKICKLLSMTKEQANKMPTQNGDFSLKQWKEVHDFFENGNLKLEDIEPSKLSYSSVQANTIEKTLNEETESIKSTDKSIRERIYDNSKPKLQEGIKAGAVSAVVEGSTILVLEIRNKIKQRKSISNFTDQDWGEIFKKAGLGTAKGGIRGISIYALTNFTATPASVANSVVSASFGIANQVYMLNKGEITQDEFIWNSELLCVDATVSALSSFIGQAVIPVPVLGAVIGNTIGNMIYQNSRDYLKKQYAQMIKRYIQDIQLLEDSLEKQYQDYVNRINDSMNKYFAVLDVAFAVDASLAFEGSIRLAKYVGVKESEILKSLNDIDNYFLG